MKFIFIGRGGDRDGYNRFVVLKYKSTLSNILISFFYSQKKLLDISGN